MMTTILGALPTAEVIAKPGSPSHCEMRPGRCARRATTRLSFASGDAGRPMMLWLLCEPHASEIERASAVPTTRRAL